MKAPVRKTYRESIAFEYSIRNHPFEGTLKGTGMCGARKILCYA